MSSSPNLSFTRFLFIVPRGDDEAFPVRLRAAGAAIARGFFNDFDAEGAREVPHETIQFLTVEGEMDPDSPIAAARYVVQVTGKYRPRLLEVEHEFRRRLGTSAELLPLEGAERAPRYSSAELHDFAYKPAAPRRSGRQMPHAFIVPISKTPEWWDLTALERHAFFYPHVDGATGAAVPGHALTAEAGIPTIFRRLFHNPDGYGREGQYDFITYFECAHEHVETFTRIHEALGDTAKNPEWRFVREGPLWRGRRVLRW
jgi:hypothetical protein